MRVCPEHSTPGEFISDVFFEKSGLILAIANRGGYKTLLVGIVNVLEMWFKKAGIIHAGAIEAQANKGYGYVRHFALKVFGDRLRQAPMMSKTEFLDGGHIEVFPMTVNKMAGPHEPKLRRDETDLAKPEGLEQSKGIPTEVDGVKINVVDISSRYYGYGNVQKMIDTAEEDGRAVHIWCYKETTQGCPDERSGTRPAQAYIDREALHAVKPEEWSRFNPNEQQNYQSYRVFDGCLSCPILATCCGDLKRAKGNQKIDEMVIKFQDAAAETWIAQYESRRAFNEGIIYKHEWKPRYHLLASLGWSIPKDWKRCGFALYRCLDFGRNRPSVGWILHDPGQNVDTHFDELEPFDMTIESLKVEIKKIDQKWGLRADDITYTWCDPAGVQRTDMDEATRIFRLNEGYNLRAVIPARLGVWNGIEEVKKRLKIVDGRTGLRVLDSCKVTVRAFESYHKKKHTQTGLWLNEPADPQEMEHPMDRIRYYVVGQYVPKSKPTLTVH